MTVETQPDMYVVILAGSFGQQLLEQLQADISGLNEAQKKMMLGLRSSLINGPLKRVNQSLAPLHERKAIEYVLRSLEGVRRLLPLKKTVRIVINEADRHLFYGTDLGTLFAEVSDLELGPDNLISNGARTPGGGQNDVTDLQAALQAIGPCKHVVVLGSSFTLLPGFNMQRVVEHSLIRNRDTLAVSPASMSDIGLFGPGGHCPVRLADTIPVPPIASIAATPGSGGPISEGDLLAQPLMVLSGTTVRDHILRSTSATTVTELAAQMLGAGVRLHAIELGVGVLRLDTPSSIDYADRYMNYFLTHIKPRLPEARDFAEMAEQQMYKSTMLKTEFMGDESEEVASGSLNRLYGHALADVAAFNKVMSEFDRLYFTGDRVASATATKYYVLPSTFYMTQTRRQYADMLK